MTNTFMISGDRVYLITTNFDQCSIDRFYAKSRTPIGVFRVKCWREV